LEIFDSAGKLVRRFSSENKPPDVDVNRLPFPTYWIKPFQPLKNERGMQRFVWDLTYPSPRANLSLPISAIYKDTPFVPQGPVVLPGKYIIKLTANGRTLTKVLNIRMDPRVKTPQPELARQFELSMQAYEGIKRSYELSQTVKGLTGEIATARSTDIGPELDTKLGLLEEKIRLLNEGTPQRPGTATQLADFPLGGLQGAFTSLLDFLQDADVAPSTQAIAASKDLQAALANAEARWKEIQTLR